MKNYVQSRFELDSLIEKAGILPFFKNRIPSWSLEERIDPSLWFTEKEGPWEWKASTSKERTSVYGKFIKGRNAWVSLELFPDLCNFRRDGYDYEGLCTDGLLPYTDKRLMDWLNLHVPIQSRTARKLSGLSKGYDTSLTRLEMRTLIVNQDFVYSIDSNGCPYGWGNALLTTPEKLYGQDFVNSSLSPSDSLLKICTHLNSFIPDVSVQEFRKMLE